jgi:hypothetical protein
VVSKRCHLHCSQQVKAFYRDDQVRPSPAAIDRPLHEQRTGSGHRIPARRERHVFSVVFAVLKEGAFPPYERLYVFHRDRSKTKMVQDKYSSQNLSDPFVGGIGNQPQNRGGRRIRVLARERLEQASGSGNRLVLNR